MSESQHKNFITIKKSTVMKNFKGIMKVVLILALVIIAWFAVRHGERTEQPALIPQDSTVCTDTIEEPVMSREDTINAMAMAFAQQESRFNHTAVSPCGRWVGCLQISEIMVREANRIVGFDCFCYDDRLDRQGSYAIFRIVMLKHNENLEIDRAISVWNKGAGPKYRQNVKNFFEHNLQNYSTLEDYFMLK